MTTILETAFQTLKTCEMTSSQYDFSSKWCGKSRSYLSWVKASRAKPSVHSLTTLLFRINAEIRELEVSPDPHFREITDYDSQKLAEIRKLVTTELERQCLLA